MRVDVITIFPELIRALSDFSIIRRARENNVVKINPIDLRDFTTDKHRSVDDSPYGGGAGMVLKPEPLFRAVEHLSAENPPDEIIVMSPGGRTFDQGLAGSFSTCAYLIIICGHYEGIDQRVLDNLATMELSIGDYVLTGGELPAMVIVDAVTRLLPGALGNHQSIEVESFQSGMLEHPQYTRPGNFRGMQVPDILLSGNHQAIDQWRRDKSLEKTRDRRPELLDKD